MLWPAAVVAVGDSAAASPRAAACDDRHSEGGESGESDATVGQEVLLKAGVRDREERQTLSDLRYPGTNNRNRFGYALAGEQPSSPEVYLLARTVRAAAVIFAPRNVKRIRDPEAPWLRCPRACVVDADARPTGFFVTICWLLASRMSLPTWPLGPLACSSFGRSVT